jgi:hypothetical protein
MRIVSRGQIGEFVFGGKSSQSSIAVCLWVVKTPSRVLGFERWVLGNRARTRIRIRIRNRTQPVLYSCWSLFPLYGNPPTGLCGFDSGEHHRQALNVIVAFAIWSVAGLQSPKEFP